MTLPEIALVLFTFGLVLPNDAPELCETKLHASGGYLVQVDPTCRNNPNGEGLAYSDPADFEKEETE